MAVVIVHTAYCILHDTCCILHDVCMVKQIKYTIIWCINIEIYKYRNIEI